MSMMSITDLFYGEREAVQILKDEQKEILEIIHRYNYFYTEPPPLSDAESGATTEESEDEDLESNWQEVDEASQDSSSQQSAVEDEDANEEKIRTSNASELEELEAKVVSKVPMCCPECEETAAIALKNVTGNQPITVGYSSSYCCSDNYRSLLTLVGIVTAVGIVMVLTTTSLHWV